MSAHLTLQLTIPMAWCWACKDDVVVWTDYSDDFSESFTRCTRCDTRLDQWGVDPGVRHNPLEDLDRMGLAVLDRSAGQGCGTGGCGGGGGCGSGAGCAATGGGGACWTPATTGRAATMAADGIRGCGSCGIKRACADTRRDRRREAALLHVLN